MKASVGEVEAAGVAAAGAGAGVKENDQLELGNEVTLISTQLQTSRPAEILYSCRRRMLVRTIKSI